MDLHTAVTVSMLALSRVRVCTVFRELRQPDPHTVIAAGSRGPAGSGDEQAPARGRRALPH